MLEVDKRICRPQALPQLFARDHLSRTLQQRGQDLKRFVLQLETVPLPPKFSAAQISFVLCKTNNAGPLIHFWEDSTRNSAGGGSRRVRQCWM